MLNWFSKSSTYLNIPLQKFARPLLGVVLFISLFSCRKEDDGPTAGIEVQPVENQLGLISTDTFEVECFTRRLDSVRTDGYTYQSVGSYVDPVFGIANNSLVTQVRLSSENIDVNQLRTFTIDSVIFAMRYVASYGNLDPQNFYIHRLTEDLLADTSYYSNHNATYETTELGSLLNHEPDLSTEFIEEDVEQPAQMRIPMDTAFGNELFNADALTYSSNEEFLKVFKGFVVRVDNPGQTVNTGGQVLFDLEDEYSRLLVYYRNTAGEAGVIEYLINSRAIKFNQSANDYTGSEVEMAFEDATVGKQNLYIQSMGGTAAVLKVPHLKELTKNGPVIINRAQFILSMKDGSNTRFEPLLNLYPFGLSEDGNLFDTPDRLESYFDPSFTSDLEYVLNMNRYYQQILDDKYEDNGLMVMELAENFGRTVIPGPEASSTPLKFVVSYTPIN